MTLYQQQPVQRSLNATQLMLLKLFNRDMTEQETKEINDMLLHYLDAKMQMHLDTDIANKGITQADFDAILNKSQRTPQ